MNDLRLDSDIQREILSNARFWQDGARYSEIKTKDKDIDNDLFNYHLQQLVKKGFLKKEGGKYYLTRQGKEVVTNIDEEDPKSAAYFKVSVYMCLINKSKILLYKRGKHPQFGYTGFPSGKIRFGEQILDTAQRELAEETGLTADFRIIGNLRQIRKGREGQVHEDGVFYICFADEFKGTLKEKSKEGEFYWIQRSKAKHIEKLFKPSVEVILQELEKYIDGKQKFFIHEMEPEPEEY